MFQDNGMLRLIGNYFKRIIKLYFEIKHICKCRSPILKTMYQHTSYFVMYYKTVLPINRLFVFVLQMSTLSGTACL